VFQRRLVVLHQDLGDFGTGDLGRRAMPLESISRSLVPDGHFRVEDRLDVETAVVVAVAGVVGPTIRWVQPQFWRKTACSTASRAGVEHIEAVAGDHHGVLREVNSTILRI
jgi:hypothetical protein